MVGVFILDLVFSIDESTVFLGHFVPRCTKCLNRCVLEKEDPLALGWVHWSI